MAEITAAAIKELREKTGAGMMDCKKALTENNGDQEAATDWLRKKGLAAAAKKSGRAAAEGLVALAADGGKGAIIELNSETDFVSRNDQFQELAKNIAEVALAEGGDIEKIKKAKYPASDRTVEDEVTEAIAVIGENIQLRRTIGLTGKNIVSYTHNQVAPNLGKIAVLVAIESEGSNEEALKQIGKQVAMHVAASKPEALKPEELDPKLIEREKAIFSEQAKASGKPDNIIEKMVEGRIRKFYAEVCLLEQAFVIDGKTPVKEALKEAEKEVGGAIKVTGYARFTLGEGVEKKEENFADEVKAVAGK